MKRMISLVIAGLLTATTVFASPGYEAGISGDKTTKKDELYYKEVVFLTGEPVLMEGTIKVSEGSKGTKTTLEYKLANTAKSAKLERKVVYLHTSSKNESERQTAFNTSADPGFKETITIGSDQFVLKDYFFSRSAINDDRAIIKYLVSNWNGRKVYTKNSGAGEVVVDIVSDLYRYDNFWSSTETSIIKNTITYKYKQNTTDTQFKETVGTAEYGVSNLLLKDLEYMSNDPQDISFKGGYVLKAAQENIVFYTYDTPVLASSIPTGKRNTGKNSYKMTTVPTQTRTFVSNIKDVSPSYWAAEDIKRMTAMDIIGMSESGYFRPLSFMSRGEFTRAIVKASDIGILTTKGRTPAFQLYNDLDKAHPYYDYIDAAVQAGIMQGIGQSSFGADDYLTKVQAAVIIIRALGLEESSDESSTVTSFSDDDNIPQWAKKSVNIARRMGIITGNEDNALEPNKILTRAESAAMINRFIRYLQYDMRKEYREKIINFGR